MVAKVRFQLGDKEMMHLKAMAANGATMKAAAAAMGWNMATLRSAGKRQNLTATLHRWFNVTPSGKRTDPAMPDLTQCPLAWLVRPWRITYYGDDAWDSSDTPATYY